MRVIELQAGRQLEVAEEVDLVPDVAIRERVVEIEIEEVEAAIGERIPLVRVVVFVLGQHVVGLELGAVG